MGFFKHVGECNGKKVIIVNRQLPGEDHMAGVIYSEIIPSRFHDDLMKVLESAEGQSANDFSNVLRRRMFSSGENMLEQLYAEGYIKKAAANNIIVKPNSKSAVRLDELNRMLTQIASGQIAQEELQTIVPEATPQAVAKAMTPVNDQITDSVTQSTVDSNALMSQMMQMMQAMQQEIANLKAEKPAKKSSAKPVKSV